LLADILPEPIGDRPVGRGALAGGHQRGPAAGKMLAGDRKQTAFAQITLDGGKIVVRI